MPPSLVGVGECLHTNCSTLVCYGVGPQGAYEHSYAMLCYALDLPMDLPRNPRVTYR